MNISIFAVVVLMSTFANAMDCPDLTGTYICEYVGGKYEIRLDQTTDQSSNIVTYIQTSKSGRKTQIKADGIQRESVRTDPGIPDGTEKEQETWLCAENRLRYIYSTKHYEKTGKFRSGVDGQADMYINGAGDLETYFVSTFDPKPWISVCSRKGY